MLNGIPHVLCASSPSQVPHEVVGVAPIKVPHLGLGERRGSEEGASDKVMHVAGVAPSELDGAMPALGLSTPEDACRGIA